MLLWWVDTNTLICAFILITIYLPKTLFIHFCLFFTKKKWLLVAKTDLMSSETLKQRIITVDALRGFALLGILLAHMIYWYNAGPLPGEYFQKHNDTASGILGFLNEILISGKFFAFFSFLFGLSFFLQMNSMEESGRPFVWRYAWRITIMGIIGLIHHAFWRGDILSIYAPLGFILLPMRKLSNKWILTIGILLAINLPSLLMQLPGLIEHLTSTTPPPPPPSGPPPGPDPSQAFFKNVYQIDIWTMMKNNIISIGEKFDFQFGSGRIYVTLGFFLLGMYSGRKGWFAMSAEELKPIFKKIKNKSGWLVLVTLIGGLGIYGLNEGFKLGWESSPVVGIIFGTLFNLNNASLVVFYVTGITLLMNRKFWQNLLYPLAPIGKMALTSYLLQTALGLVLFFGFGFGLVGVTPPWLNWLIAIAFFIVQAFFCKWWFKQFYFGPVEWLWRTATYFKIQPFRKK